MTRRDSPWLIGAVAIAGALALTAWRFRLNGRRPVDLSWPLAIILAFNAGLLWFAMFTWRRLRPRDARESKATIIYVHGVRGFGLAMGVAMTVWLGLKDAAPLTFASFAVSDIWLRLTTAALINVPLGLWAGYAWGRAMASVFTPPID